jgi:hypothetical protein
MTQSPNQFAQTAEKGQLTLDPNWATLNCQVDSGEAGTLLQAQPVVGVDVAGAQIPVEAIAAITDPIFGFIPYSVKTNEYVALDQVKIAKDGDIMHMEASAAIARFAELEVVIAGVKVATQATGTTIGVALDKAAADGDLIRVLITV